MELIAYYAILVVALGLVGLIPLTTAVSTGKKLGNGEVSWQKAVALTAGQCFAIPITIMVFLALAIVASLNGKPLSNESLVLCVGFVTGTSVAIWIPVVAMGFRMGKNSAKSETRIVQLQTQSLKEGKS